METLAKVLFWIFTASLTATAISAVALILYVIWRPM